MNFNLNGRFFIIAAPSGAGKTTLTHAAIKKLSPKYNISKVITYTSRPPRKDEVDGKDYHFLSKEEFIKKQKENFFLEITQYNNNFYGSPTDILAKAKEGTSFIFVADRAGAKSALKLLPEPILIWIEPPSLEELKNRLTKRKSESEEQLNRRLNLAEQEMAEEKSEQLFKHHLINDDFEITVSKLVKIIEDELNKEKTSSTVL